MSPIPMALSSLFSVFFLLFLLLFFFFLFLLLLRFYSFSLYAVPVSWTEIQRNDFTPGFFLLKSVWSTFGWIGVVTQQPSFFSGVMEIACFYNNNKWSTFVEFCCVTCWKYKFSRWLKEILTIGVCVCVCVCVCVFEREDGERCGDLWTWCIWLHVLLQLLLQYLTQLLTPPQPPNSPL